MKNMKIGIVIVIIISLVSCATAPKLTTMQMRQLTTRIYEGDYENTFRAILTVLQDQGYVVKNTDMDTGLINAIADKETSTGSQMAQVLFVGYIANKGSKIDCSFMVNKINEEKTEIRLNIYEASYGQSSKWSSHSQQSSKQILDEEIYKQLFDQIHVEIERRKAING